MAAQHAQAVRASGGLARARGAGGRWAVGVRPAPSRHAAQRHPLAVHVRHHAALHDQEAEPAARTTEEGFQLDGSFGRHVPDGDV